MKEKKKKKKILFRPVSKQIFYLNSISCSFPYRATITDNYFSSFLLLFSLFPLLFSSFFQTWCLWRFITKYNQVSPHYDKSTYFSCDYQTVFTVRGSRVEYHDPFADQCRLDQEIGLVLQDASASILTRFLRNRIRKNEDWKEKGRNWKFDEFLQKSKIIGY